jgi:hypothetical protein
MKRLLALLLLLPAAIHAESGAYRVELLVFSHADSAAVPLEVDGLRSFATAYPLDGELLPRHAADPAPLDVTSDMLQDIRRRLERSAGYEPLLFIAWEQSRIDFQPPVRVHDGEVIFESLRFPGGIAFIDLREPDLLAPYLDRHYRLDGMVQLRRSRFLHLDLDLEYREEVFTRGAVLPATAEEARLSGLAWQGEAVPASDSSLVHVLQQSRQIRTGQLQYFDTPFLGVLARVTATAGE